MTKTNIKQLLQNIYQGSFDCCDIEQAISLTNPKDITKLFCFADNIRRHHIGDEILLRGIVEISNHCKNTCLYCGLNRNNHTLHRYRLTTPRILECVNQIANSGIKTVVIQSGEDTELSATWLAQLITEIKSQFDIAVTLSLGERTYQDYKLLKQAGADRYLLKIETSSKELYNRLHPEMSFHNRLRCLEYLDQLDYQTGTGNLIGLKSQTIKTLAKDLIFLKNYNPDMISIGPFLPHSQTPLGNQPPGDINLSLKVLALARIVNPDAHMPATTALGSFAGKDLRFKALQAGANVIMPNFTSGDVKRFYEIYPGKKCFTQQPNHYIKTLEKQARAIGRHINYSRGDGVNFSKRKAAIIN